MKRKLIVPILLTACVVLSACKPSGIDDRTYKLGKDAVELAQDYLDGKLPMEEAKDKMHDIYNELDRLDFDSKEEQQKYHHNVMVRTKVSSFNTPAGSFPPGLNH